MKRELVYYGDPILREKSQPVKDINEEVLALIQDMIKVMHAAHGVGLAAVQVGVPLRVFICTVYGVDKEGYPLYGAPKVYINPSITILDPTEWSDSEGCLSVPKIYEAVPRPKKIRVEALNEKGEPFVEEREGWMARPILHENDHLNGVLFFDRVSPHRKQALQAQLKKVKKKHSASSH
jgi:peptide deformylase